MYIIHIYILYNRIIVGCIECENLKHDRFSRFFPSSIVLYEKMLAEKLQ